MRALLSTYGSRGDTEFVAAQFDTVAAATEECECDAPVATGVMPTGGWR